jgi:hypothetical protein
MPWDRDDPDPVRHDDMLALARDPKSYFLQRANRVEMIDAGDFRQD